MPLRKINDFIENTSILPEMLVLLKIEFEYSFVALTYHHCLTSTTSMLIWVEQNLV